MRLFSFGERPERRPDSHWPFKAFRWALDVGLQHAWIVWECQDKKTDEWHTTDHVFGIFVGARFMLGIRHDYYDGPHCQLAIGWLKILWSGNPFTGWCRKCMP